MKYTAEEVRKSADWLYQWERKAGARNARAMLTAYAARIEADEMAADYPECSGDPASCPENEGFGCCKAHAETITLHPPAQAAQVDPAAKPHTLSDFVHAPDAELARTGQQVAARVDEMMAEPVAQAARVDQVGELLAIIHGDGGHYQAEHGLQKAAKDAQEKVIQMMTKIATAEPAAPGEAVSGVDLHDRIEFALRDAGFGLDEASILAERATAQPAQLVDIEAIRKMIAHLRSFRSNTPPTWAHLDDAADKLEAALQDPTHDRA